MAYREHTPPLIINMTGEVTNWSDFTDPPPATSPPASQPASLRLGTFQDGVLRSPTPDCICPPGCICEQDCCRSCRFQVPPRGRCSPSFSVSSYGSTDSNEPLIRPPRREESSLVAAGPVPSGTPNVSIRCGCHVKVEESTSKKARNKLIAACFIALVFMLGEFIGGYLAGSLAIMTDAAHMLSDFASFLISLFAIWIATRPPSKKFSFGWHRAEVVGAVISVLIIWVLTGVLVYEAILRCIHRNFDIDANVMLITACSGVFVNVFMMAVLGHGHGHSHGGGHGHSHGGGGHGHSRGKAKEEVEEEEKEEEKTAGGEGACLTSKLKKKQRRKKRRTASENINVRAAFIHVIGDLIQSIGVVIAGYIVWFKPEWKLADPICTFLFSILVLFSTINVLRDALRVLMEGTPRHIDYEEVKAQLMAIPGVKHAHSLHIWSLTMNKTAAAAHLAMEPGMDSQEVLDRASQMLKEKYNISQSTLQVETYRAAMDDCGTCQNRNSSSGRRFSLKFWQNGNASHS